MVLQKSKGPLKPKKTEFPKIKRKIKKNHESNQSNKKAGEQKKQKLIEIHDYQKKGKEKFSTSKNEILIDLYSRAKQIYTKYAGKQLENYNISKSDQMWMKKILSSGTMNDKISGLSIYIRDNPKCTLNCIQNMFEYCNGNSRKDSMASINALKNLFIEVLLPKNTLVSFVEKTKKITNLESKPEDFWIDCYYESSLKQIYMQFIKLLETKANDPISFIRKNIISYLCELILKKNEQESSIVKILVNKFAESDKTINSHLNASLGKLLYKRPNLMANVIKEIEEFIYRPNLNQTSQLHALNFLNSLQTEKMSQEVLMSLQSFFFKLFNKIVEINNEEVISSKLTINILKGINKIFPKMKENFPEMKENNIKEIDNLYKIIHQTSNFKIKIQTMLFIFQFLNAEKSLNDRYYRVLYELLHSEQIWHSSLTELFFDLLYFSLKEDTSILRIKSFVKRLLQNSIHSDPAFLITSLIFISRIFQIHPGVKTLITYNETRDENDIEQFKDLNNSSDGEDISQSGEKNEIVEKIEQKSYDPFKRDPLYSNADKTCLWELISLLNHYHPYVKKYAEALIEDINKSNSIIDYNGNPLLDFNLANFLDRLTFKKTKKKESSGIKSLINKNKLRMSKIKDPLSIEEVSKLKENELREDEKYFLKYFEQKKERNVKKGKFKPKKKKIEENDDDFEAFADDVVEAKMNELNKGEDIDEDYDEFDEFLKEELEDEQASEDNEEFVENENLENLFDEDQDNELEEIRVKKRFSNPMKKEKKKKKGLNKLNKRKMN